MFVGAGLLLFSKIELESADTDYFFVVLGTVIGLLNVAVTPSYYWAKANEARG